MENATIVRRVSIDPPALDANTDRGYVVTASVDGSTLRIEAECVVVSDSGHVSPAYRGYIVAPMVYDDDRIPSLAEQVAEELGWTPGYPASRREPDARRWLREHVDLVLETYGD